MRPGDLVRARSPGTPYEFVIADVETDMRGVVVAIKGPPVPGIGPKRHAWYDPFWFTVVRPRSS